MSICSSSEASVEWIPGLFSLRSRKWTGLKEGDSITYRDDLSLWRENPGATRHLIHLFVPSYFSDGKNNILKRILIWGISFPCLWQPENVKYILINPVPSSHKTCVKSRVFKATNRYAHSWNNLWLSSYIILVVPLPPLYF